MMSVEGTSLTTGMVVAIAAAVTVVLCVFFELVDDGVSTIIRAMRSPRQIIVHCVCKRCGKVRTSVEDPEEE